MTLREVIKYNSLRSMKRSKCPLFRGCLLNYFQCSKEGETLAFVNNHFLLICKRVKLIDACATYRPIISFHQLPNVWKSHADLTQHGFRPNQWSMVIQPPQRTTIVVVAMKTCQEDHQRLTNKLTLIHKNRH